MTDHARDQAKAQLESIQEMVRALDAENDGEREKAELRIQEDAWKVAVRADWHQPGEGGAYDEYMILLCTGGPACRIKGALSANAPMSAIIEYQNWGAPWEKYPISGEEEETLLRYAQQFYFES
uniref:Uncharacterized protein n=1 Tax=viral metagenome TaxID=1070528 RepID=A0A6M3K0F1_9ZZZZ